MGELTISPQTEELRPRHPGGRPTLYSHTVAQAICDKIEAGMTKRGACGLFGVNEETFRLWQDTREEFIQMLMRAEARAEERFTEPLLKAAEGTQGQADYRAGVEWLKRRRRADYGDTLDIRKLDVDTIRELMQQQADSQQVYEPIEPGEDDL